MLNFLADNTHGSIALEISAQGCSAARVERTARTSNYYHCNLAQNPRETHNVSMGLGLLFRGFLQAIAVGAAAVLALLFIMGIRIPRRSAIVVHRRTTHQPPPS